MPVLRYFIFVGGALLALMIGLSSFLSEPEAIARPDAVRPVIRIASDSVGPPRVDIDTRVQIAVVPATVPEIVPPVTWARSNVGSVSVETSIKARRLAPNVLTFE